MKVFLFDYRPRHAQAIIYSLRKHGYDVVVGTDDVPGYHFGVSKFHRWDGKIDSLIELLHREAIRIVMPISIPSFRFCSQERAAMDEQGIKVLVPELPTWLRLYNKGQTYELATRYGIPVPTSVTISLTNYRDQIAAA